MLLLRLLPLVLALISLAPSPSAAQQESRAGRVVVLGIDGGDARTAKELMDKGQLPNLAALAAEGTFGPLSTTNPAESPVSWSSLNCGQNPAKTGIPGFVVRGMQDGEATATPSIGFFENVQRELDEVRGVPVPRWRPAVLALFCGVTVGLVFLLLFALLLRVRARPALVLSLSLALVAAWGGFAVRGYLPQRFPVVANPLKAEPFWEVAARAGVRGVVLDAAQAWDRRAFDGCDVLAGLGVPDARGNYNGFTLYTTDDFVFATRPDASSSTASGGDRLRLEERGGKLVGRVFGPVDFARTQRLEDALERVDGQLASATTYGQSQTLEQERARLEESLEALQDEPLSEPLEIVREDGAARVKIGASEQRLTLGEWSEFYPLTFESNPLVRVHALVRAKLLRMEPVLELYLDTLQLDPKHPPFWQPISHPAGYSRRLAQAAGPFETVGWACMNLPYKDGLVDPVSFLEDIEFTFQWRRRLTMDQFERGDWRLLFTCFSTPDRVQHMTYKFYDREHPQYRAEQAAQRMTFFGEEITLAEAIPAIYRAVDRLVGELRSKLAPNDVLLICSDHGFQSFRRQVHLNNWLAEQGYLVLKGGAAARGADLVIQYADMAKTRAYAIGLGTVYLNLRGRETTGIVEPDEAEALLKEIAAKLLASRDERGQAYCLSAQPASALHQGPHLDREADLLVGFAPGYRVSWLTTTGGFAFAKSVDGGQVPAPVLVDNDKSWSGDHVSVDPLAVRGLFYCNRKLAVPPEGFDLRQVAPTVLHLLGVDIPKEYDLGPLRP
jgi:predicted AlkP superfamily phosphohydrolase/phosphomutase